MQGRGPRQSAPLRVTAAQEGDQCALRARRGEQVLTLADVTRAIAVVETAGRVENDLAETLRAMAAQGQGAAAARRLRLAEDAARGAKAAAQTSDRLQQQARRLAELADAAALRQRLAQTDPARTQPEGILADNRPAETRLESYTSARLADIDRRIGGLRQARPKVSGDSPEPAAGLDTGRRAREAYQRWRESVVHLQQARQLTAAAFRRAARAHDRAAEAYARSARTGTDDVAEHSRRAAFHRAAADADRQQAQNIEDQAAGSAEGIK